MRKEAIAVIVAVLIVASIGLGYFSGSSTKGTETTTSTSTSVSTSTLTSQVTITATPTTTSPLSANTTLVLGQNGTILQLHVPWSGVGTDFLGASTLTGGGPALVASLNQVVVFDCASQAATPQGCTREVNASVSSAYQVTIWYPYSPTPGEYWTSWANCAYSSPTDGTDVPAYCIPLGANDFIVAAPQPGPA